MGKKIVITGRGGTGKSTFAALAVGLLPSPTLAVDTDPDRSLADMLGADLAEEDVLSISEALFGLREDKNRKELQAMPLVEKVQYLLNLSCLYESERFDMITLGVKWTRGCYCAPNDILHMLIPEIAGNYAFTIIDSPAGLEHLNRRVLSEVDDIFAVVDPSAKSIRNTENVRDMASSVGFTFENLYVVASHTFPADQTARLRELSGAKYLGKIEADPTVQQYEWESRSLLELPGDSPARVSVGAILQNAGYAVV